MATQLFANNAASVLASGITDVASSLTITTGHGLLFPTITGSDYFLVTLCQMSGGYEVNFEIVKVTVRATDTFTIVRAQEGTTALAYNIGDKVELRLTKGAIEGYEATSHKDATDGYAGLTLFKLNLKNAANTFTNFFTSATTAARTWTMQDRDGTIADDTDLATKAPLASPTFTGTVTLPTLVGTSTTEATTPTAAAFKTAGGLGVAKDVRLGKDLYQSYAGIGASYVYHSSVNTDNTDVGSHNEHHIAVGGSSAGDPFTSYFISGVTSCSVGLDNSDSDKFKVSFSTGLGTNDALTITPAGAVTIPGTLTVTGGITGLTTPAAAYTMNYSLFGGL